MKPPIPNSYWVEPARLLAGEHPDGGSDGATRSRLAQLVESGIRTFIDLTQEGELPPYRQLLPPGVAYHNFPVRDHSIPDSPEHMRQIQHALVQALREGGGTYVHCRAGIGRTGITVGCYLRETGRAPLAALDALNQLWLQNARAARWPTIPETEEQESYILEWQPAGPAAGRHAVPLAANGDRPRGCLIGLAVADALADVPAGGEGGALSWTDDTGLALCVAESLVARSGFDGRDQLERFRAWSLDPGAAGAAPTATLRPVVKSVLTRALWNRSAVLGSHDPAELDASPLARCAAVGVFAAGRVAVAAALGADVARVTHQAPLVVDACRLFSVMLCLAVSGAPREQILSADARIGGLPLREELRGLVSGWRVTTGRRRPQPGVLGALDRAARCFARSRGFADGLDRARAGRSEDRDAVCAAYGALAGAFHAEKSIDMGWQRRVRSLARIAPIADALRREGSRVHAVPA